MFKKNVSGQWFGFAGVDVSTGGPKSGVTWTVRRCIDGTFAAATGTATEDGTTGGYKFAMSQADTNGNNISFHFTGTGAVPFVVSIITDGAPPDINVAKWVTGTPNALQSGRVDAYLGAVASGVIAAASFASGALDAVWSTAVRTLSAFSFTNVSANVEQWRGTQPNILQSGRVDSYVGAILNGVITAASHAAGALDAVWSTTTRTLSAFAFSVTVGTNNDKTGYTASTVSDKTGYGLSSGGLQAIWDVLTSALTTAGSVGKRIADNLDVAVGTRAGFSIKKNTVLNDFKFPMFDADDHVTPLPGLTVTAERMIDTATTWSACENSVVECSDGTYSYDFATADLNGTSILFRFSATGADDQFVTIVTEAA